MRRRPHPPPQGGGASGARSRGSCDRPAGREERSAWSGFGAAPGTLRRGRGRRRSRRSRKGSRTRHTRRSRQARRGGERDKNSTEFCFKPSSTCTHVDLRQASETEGQRLVIGRHDQGLVPEDDLPRRDVSGGHHVSADSLRALYPEGVAPAAPGRQVEPAVGLAAEASAARVAAPGGGSRAEEAAHVAQGESQRGDCCCCLVLRYT